MGQHGPAVGGGGAGSPLMARRRLAGPRNLTEGQATERKTWDRLPAVSGSRLGDDARRIAELHTRSRRQCSAADRARPPAGQAASSLSLSRASTRTDLHQSSHALVSQAQCSCRVPNETLCDAARTERERLCATEVQTARLQVVGRDMHRSGPKTAAGPGSDRNALQGPSCQQRAKIAKPRWTPRQGYGGWPEKAAGIDRNRFR